MMDIYTAEWEGQKNGLERGRIHAGVFPESEPRWTSEPLYIAFAETLSVRKNAWGDRQGHYGQERE